MGTPVYMSPEQMARSKTADARTDIWALGVILYELLSRISPFKAPTMPEVIARVLQEEPAPLRNLRPDIPPALDAVISRCLQKRREDRFQTVREVAAALEPFGASPAREPMASSTSENVKPALVATDSITLPLPGAAAASVGGSTGSAWGKTQANSSPKGRSKGGFFVALGLTSVLLLLGVWFWVKEGSPPQVASATPGISASAAPSVEVAPVPDPPPQPTAIATAAAASAVSPPIPTDEIAQAKPTEKPSRAPSPGATSTAPQPTPTATVPETKPKAAATTTAPRTPKPIGFDD